MALVLPLVISHGLQTQVKLKAGQADQADEDLLELVKGSFPKGAELVYDSGSWTVALPAWTLDAPLFSNSETEASWRQLPMPFWEEGDVERTGSKDKFRGKSYTLQLSMDHDVLLPSFDDVSKRCNEGRWPSGTASLHMPQIKFLEGTRTHKSDSKVIVAARPAGGLWAHWVDNTFLKFAWLYPLMQADAEHWTIYDTHGTRAQKGILQVIDLLKLHDVDSRALDATPDGDRVVSSLLTVCDLPSVHPLITQGARKAVLSAAGVPDQSVEDLKQRSECAVVYMQRNGPSTSNGRAMPDEDELYNRIQKYVAVAGPSRGFNATVLRFSFDEGFSLKHTVTLLSRGCVFVGAHGAALYHILWGAQNAALIELWPKEDLTSGPGSAGGLSYNVFWSIAQALDYRYEFGLYSRASANYTETQELLEKAM